MKKTFLLKSFMLLCMLMTGMGAWGETASKTNSSFTSVSGTLDENISYSTAQAGGTTAPVINSGNIRLYRKSSSTAGLGSTLTISPSQGVSGVTITNVTFTLKSSLGYSYTVDGGTAVTGTNSTISIDCSATTSVVLQNNSISQMDVTGVTVTYTLSGGGSDPVDASWSVSPASVSVKTAKTETATITTNYNGTLSVASNNTGVATATINGKVITVTGVAEGSTTLTVTGAATSKYNAISKTIDVTVTPNVVTPGTYNITPNNIFFNCDAFTTKPAGFTTATGVQNDITIVYTAATNAYINDAQCRAYSGTKLGFSVPTGYDITAIAFTADASNWAGTHTASVGTMTDSKNWTGAANDVTITFGGNCRITKITVTYAAQAASHNVVISNTIEHGTITADVTKASKNATVTLDNTPDDGYRFVSYSVVDAESNAVTVTDGKFTMPDCDVTVSGTFELIPSVAAPVITPATGTYTESQTVTISAADGCTIFYTTDGTDPDNGTEYTGSFQVTATTTVRAIAMDNEANFSDEATSVITIVEPKALVAYYDGKYYAATTTVENKVMAAVEVRVIDGCVVNANDKASISWVVSGDKYMTPAGEYLAYSSTNLSLSVSESSLNDANRGLIYREDANGFKYYATSNAGSGDYSEVATLMSFLDLDDEEFEELCTTSRTVTTGTYGTVCLPYNVEAADITGATFYEIEGKDAEDVHYIALSEVEKLTAGVPYIFKATASNVSLVYSGDAVNAAGNSNGLHGVFVDTPFAGWQACEDNDIFVVLDDKIQAASTESGVRANRAYIKMSEVPVVTPSAAKKLVYLGLDGEATGIKNVEASESTVRYNLNGQRVNTNVKGIVIVNGRKFVNK